MLTVPDGFSPVLKALAPLPAVTVTSPRWILAFCASTPVEDAVTLIRLSEMLMFRFPSVWMPDAAACHGDVSRAVHSDGILSVNAVFRSAGAEAGALGAGKTQDTLRVDTVLAVCHADISRSGYFDLALGMEAMGTPGHIELSAGDPQSPAGVDTILAVCHADIGGSGYFDLALGRGYRGHPGHIEFAAVKQIQSPAGVDTVAVANGNGVRILQCDVQRSTALEIDGGGDAAHGSGLLDVGPLEGQGGSIPFNVPVTSRSAIGNHLAVYSLGIGGSALIAAEAHASHIEIDRESHSLEISIDLP